MGEILVPVSVRAPTSLAMTWSSTLFFQISAQTVEAELRMFKLLFKMSMEHVVSFPATQDSLLIKMEDSRACLEGTQDGEVEQTQRTNTKHSKLFFEMEELKVQAQKDKEREKGKILILENEKVLIRGNVDVMYVCMPVYSSFLSSSYACSEVF